MTRILAAAMLTLMLAATACTKPADAGEEIMAMRSAVSDGYARVEMPADKQTRQNETATVESAADPTAKTTAYVGWKDCVHGTTQGTRMEGNFGLAGTFATQSDRQNGKTTTGMMETFFRELLRE